MKCPKCGYPNPSSVHRTACYKCGMDLFAIPPPQAPASSSVPVCKGNTVWIVEWSKAEFGIGCLQVWGTGGALFIVGLILCCIGAVIVGVPLVLLGFATPLAAPLVGVVMGRQRKLQGKCPICDLLINVGAQAVQQMFVDCPGCRSRILILNEQFVKPAPPRP